MRASPLVLALLLLAGAVAGWLLLGVRPAQDTSGALPDEGLTIVGGCLGDPASHGVDPATGEKRPPYSPARAPEPPAWVRELGPYGASAERVRFFRWIRERPLRLLDYVAWIALKESARPRTPDQVHARCLELFEGASPSLDGAVSLLACELEAPHGPRFLAGVLGLLARLDANPVRAPLRALAARKGAPWPIRRLAAGILLGLDPLAAADLAAVAPMLREPGVAEVPNLAALLGGLGQLEPDLAQAYVPVVLALEAATLGPAGELARLRFVSSRAARTGPVMRLLADALAHDQLAMRQLAAAVMFPDAPGREHTGAWRRYLEQAPLSVRVAYVGESIRRDRSTAAALATLVLPALSDDAPELRDRAAALLDRLDADVDDVLPRVQGLVTSGDAARQRTATRALAALADTDAPAQRLLPLVRSVASSGDAGVRAAAVEAVAKLSAGTEAGGLLAQLAADRAAVVRAEVVDVLAERLDDDEAARELLEGMRRDGDPGIRARVAEILAEADPDDG